MNSEKSLKLCKFGRFSFHMDTLELRRDTVHIPLRPRAARLLAVLLEHQGELVKHDELRTALWGDRIVEWQDGLHQAVRDVRIALDDTNKPPKFIENIPRLGYKFLDVEQSAPSIKSVPVFQRARYFGLGAVTFPVVFLAGCLLVGAG